MSDCQRCGGRANDAFLCHRCQTTLHAALADLPWWLERLTETALGHTRMSDNAGRKSASRRDLDGDKGEAAHIEALPGCRHKPDDDCDCDLDKARKAREKLALAHALAIGGVNAKASELLSDINDSLGYWLRILCEQRGLTPPNLGAGRTLGALRAKWMLRNLDAIALSDCAGDITMDIENHHDDIIEMVNRPVRFIALGNCPTWNEKRNDSCGVPLRAPEDSAEVYCRRCRVTHSCNRLLLERMNEAEREVMPFADLVRVNQSLPTEYQVARRTLQHWRTTGLLRARQWRRPDGRRGITQHGDGDVPLYSWSDVKRLQLRKPQKVATGAAAHRPRS